ncbi:MAG: hypothetical protein OEM99_10105 [Gammaproteobacteria bacterium]|nr:hypothetical protein [Gammaproteobacteria bacterium]
MSKWLGLLSLLTLCAAVLWLSPAMGAPVIEKGVRSTIQAPAGAVQKKPVTPQQLKIVSAATSRPITIRSNLYRSTVSDLEIDVEVQNTSKETLAFILRPELPGIPGSVQPSQRFTIRPLETRTYFHVVNRVNPGARSGNIRGVVRLMNETAQKVLDSSEFNIQVVDNRTENDLKVDAVKITRVTMTSNRSIDSVKFAIIFSNAGREIFGYPIRLLTELRTRIAEGTMRRLTPQEEKYVTSGLQPDEKKTVSIEKAWPRGGANTGLWHTLAVTLSADSDRDMSNNQIDYSFIIDNNGKVIASNVEWPTR